MNPDGRGGQILLEQDAQVAAGTGRDEIEPPVAVGIAGDQRMKALRAGRGEIRGCGEAAGPIPQQQAHIVAHKVSGDQVRTPIAVEIAPGHGLGPAEGRSPHRRKGRTRGWGEPTPADSQEDVDRSPVGIDAGDVEPGVAVDIADSDREGTGPRVRRTWSGRKLTAAIAEEHHGDAAEMNRHQVRCAVAVEVPLAEGLGCGRPEGGSESRPPG